MLEIALHNSRQHRQFQHHEGPLVLTRMHHDGQLWIPVNRGKSHAGDALVQIVPEGNRIALTTTGCRAVCVNCKNTGRTGRFQLPVPATFAIGDTRFEICDTASLVLDAARPLEKLFKENGNLLLGEATGAGPASATISRWFAAIGSLNRWPTSLQELYAQAAKVAVDAIGLDGVVLLRRRDERWEIAASHLPQPELGIHCEVTILDELLRTPETLFHGTADSKLLPHTAKRTTPAVVVSPLRNAAGELAGAIYGYRSVRAGNARRGIRYLEAHMIEMLAGAVSEGIARMEHEAEVERRRVLLERALAASPDSRTHKFAGETRAVTLLFADLRQSTELSASLEIDQSFELLSHVMDCLTAAVMSHDGMVIDYYGDGLAAMWNAPADQAEHVELACRAALKMLERLPDVTADWASLLQTNLRLAIGIHTGMVQVGNAGSAKRMKYGPRGPNVHVASRTEAAAKEFNAPLVVTAAAAERLSNEFATHRICRARLRGVEEPTDLFAVTPATIDGNLASAWETYAAALAMFEQGELSRASELLQQVDAKIETVPSCFLAQHVENALNRRRRRRSTDSTDAANEAIITLGGK